MVNGQPGKGDRYRPVDQKKWEENWDKAFASKKTTKKKSSGIERPNKERDTNNE
jgi:hypothetical protein